MRISTLLARNLAWFWRTNLAVLLGVATATAVLAGALLVGDSVRASLRDLVLSRLGNTESVVTSQGFFREKLAREIGPACPMIAVDGIVAHESSGRRTTRVQVYGVDERFWKFQREEGEAPRVRQILLSAALAQELGSKPGDSILLRVQKPSAIPLESMHGRKDNVGQTIRMTMSGTAAARLLPASPTGRRARGVRAARQVAARSGRAGQGEYHSCGPPAGPQRVLKQRYRLEDLGLRLRRLEAPDCWSLDSDAGMIADAPAGVALSTAKSLGLRAEPILSYLANSIRIGNRETPYSLVTALDAAPAPAADDGITLNEWAARDLAAKPGDAVTLDYYVWKSEGRLDTASAQFRVERIVPITGAAADRNLAPVYPGITDSDSLHDWDPPFPLDLGRVRPIDEQYWKQYRATPKAFVRLARARRLWGTRFGQSRPRSAFSRPARCMRSALRDAIDPSAAD